VTQELARAGITEPFPIQSATIPDALAGRDVLGRGRTGSGKTLAFGLPTLTRLSTAGGKASPRRPRALVLVPTRELAIQVAEALLPITRTLHLTQRLVAGGMPYPPQVDALKRGVDLLVATPGRLIDLVEKGAADLSDVSIAILDEADHMADMGFMPEVTAILDQIPEGGQRLLFSATLDRGVDALVARYLTDPVEHATDPGTATITTMEHHVLHIDPKHKKALTAELANREGRTVVFVRTKLGADRVAEQLREAGIMAAALHGGLNQSQRGRVLDAFREGRLPVLVATDVAARGLHVDDIAAVVQVDPPADHKDYLHRAGRTARAGESGKVVTLALPHQRRGMARLASEAGVDIAPMATQPGDSAMHKATGASTPSGVSVPEEAMRRIIDRPTRHTGSQRPRYQGPSQGQFGRGRGRHTSSR
jgi:superfamily II DNA/RNA helicase